MTATTSTKKSAITTDIFGDTLTLNFSNGKELALSLSQLTPAMRDQAALHGLKQKLVDAAALPCNTTTGRSATIDDKFSAIDVVLKRITDQIAPTWNAVREGGTTATGGIFLRAMMSITGKDHPTMKIALDKMTKEQVAALKKNPKVMEKMHELELAAVAGSVDTSDSLLDQLMNVDSGNEPTAAPYEESDF